MRRLILVAVSLLIASWLAASAAAQGAEQSASQSKVIALENAWNQAEERKDAKALDTILDSSLVYTDYDGSMMNKADFLASVKSPSRHPEQQVTESDERSRLWRRRCRDGGLPR